MKKFKIDSHNIIWTTAEVVILIMHIMAIAIVAMGVVIVLSTFIESRTQPDPVESVVTELSDPLVVDAEDIPTTSENVIDEATEGDDVVLYYDIPLSYELQDHIFAVCESQGVESSIVIAMIERESRYDPSAIGDNGNSLGLMQIQPRWNYDRMEELDCHDLLDPYQNVTVGIDVVADYISTGNSIEWVLMAYNGGPSYANKKVEAGEVSDYANWVLNRASELVKSIKK